MKRDFVSIRDWGTDDLREIFVSAIDMKATPEKYASALRGKTLAMIFEKPSLRTRVTFDVGIQQLGGFSLYLSPAEIALGKRESVADIAHNLERMVQAVMIRTFSHELVVEMARTASIPVINGLTDFSHPCQAMADYMTMLEVKGDLQSIKVAYVGDGNNVAHSLIFGAARFGVHLALATPEGYSPAPGVVKWAEENGGDTGLRLELSRDAVSAVSRADVVYTDVWASMGQEDEAEKRNRVFKAYQVNDSLMAHAAQDAVFMHCLPAHRGSEVEASVIDSPRSVVFQQAENRLHVQKAILKALMD